MGSEGGVKTVSQGHVKHMFNMTCFICAKQRAAKGSWLTFAATAATAGAKRRWVREAEVGARATRHSQ